MPHAAPSMFGCATSKQDPSNEETVLTTLAGTTSTDRLLVVLCRTPQRESWLELRQQSWGEGVGWFNQSTVQVEPSQVALLRNALGSGNARSTQLPASFRPVASPDSPPRSGQDGLRVVRADSA